MKQKGDLRRIGAVFGNGLLLRNPLLVAALGMYPAAVCFSLSQALPLACLCLVQSVLAGLVLCLAGQFLPGWARPGIVLALSAVCWIPAALLADRWFPGSLSVLGMAAGPRIANSMGLSRLNEYAPTHILPAVLADALGCTIGAGIFLCAQAALRGWLLTGEPWDASGFDSGVLGSAPALPFFGFLILGFCAAAVQAVNARRAKHIGRRRVTRL